MVRLTGILLFTLILISCTQTKKTVVKKSNEVEIKNATHEDSTEYELVILDPRFESYLLSVPYNKEFYSNSYYKTWIHQYVVEWNSRHSDPIRYGDFYETYIDYDPTIDYGIDLNFKLYHYFLFIEKEYGIVLLRRKM